MLKHLRIQNFAIIDETSIDFGEGLNIISGETGAGKSILMDALMLILGGRASSDLIRHGSEEASVEALFEITDPTDLNKCLESAGILPHEELIVRRIVHRSGKNRIFVNGSMVNISALQSITSSLVDLCSQHDQQLLSKSEEQLFWIDRFGNLEEKRKNIKSLFQSWREKSKMLENLSTDSSMREQRIDFLKFQIQELEEAEIKNTQEDLDIQNELKLLESAEDLFAFSAEAETALFGEEGAETPSLLVSLGNLTNRAKTLVSLDPKLNTALELLTQFKIHADELGYFLRSYSQSLCRDENKLEELNARASLLAKMKKKYGPTLEEAMLNYEAFKSELAKLQNHDSSLKEAENEMKNALELFQNEASVLTKSRSRAAKDFSVQVEKELAELHMGGARFRVDLLTLQTPSINGLDEVHFQIAANPGETMGSLNKVASGGELSRVMLAMHNVVSSRGNVGVYLFDEVDAGIGGSTAIAVGAKLQSVAKNNQVICITHLPQVAAFANFHFHVEKSVKRQEGKERTFARVIPLQKEEREIELARMLGGNSKDKASLANARAMLEKYQPRLVSADKKMGLAKTKSSTHSARKTESASNKRGR
jgi:DNA repair protein RecN (Recombination protein N)